MVEERQETIADIVAELRNKTGNMYDCTITTTEDEVHDYADRLEAAWKREKNAPEQRSPSASQVSPMPVNDAHIIPQIVNAAQMRNALERILSLTNSLDENCAVDPVEIRDIARNALAAPPRNCDMLGGDEDKLFDCYIQERKYCKYKHLSPDYGFWLLKTAKKKGEEKC